MASVGEQTTIAAYCTNNGPTLCQAPRVKQSGDNRKKGFIYTDTLLPKASRSWIVGSPVQANIDSWIEFATRDGSNPTCRSQ